MLLKLEHKTNLVGVVCPSIEMKTSYYSYTFVITPDELFLVIESTGKAE